MALPAAAEPATTATAPRAALAAPADARRKAQALLAAAWPAVGTRHDAKLAMSGGLARDGWPQTEVLEFMGALPTEDASKLAADVRSTYERMTAGKAFTGWRNLESYVGAGVVSDVRKLLGGTAAIEAKLAEVRAANDTAPAVLVAPFPAPHRARAVLVS